MYVGKENPIAHRKYIINIDNNFKRNMYLRRPGLGIRRHIGHGNPAKIPE